MSENPTNTDRIQPGLVATSGMFGFDFERRRCIVPADALHEWKVAKGGKQPTTPRQPNPQDRPFERTLARPWVDRWETM